MNYYLQEKLNLIKKFQTRVSKEADKFEFGNQTAEEFIWVLGEIMQDIGYDLQHGDFSKPEDGVTHWEDKTPAELRDLIVSFNKEEQ